MRAVVIASLLCAGQVQALSLGKVSILSALGEPLMAEIDIPQITPEEEASLKVGVASADTFRAAGVDLSPVLIDARLKLDRRPNGRVFLRLQSNRAATEPFLDLILEANWASGRIVRDYTLLLDPPNLQPTSPPPLSASISSPPSPSPTAQPRPPVPQVAPPALASTTPPVPAAAPAAPRPAPLAESARRPPAAPPAPRDVSSTPGTVVTVKTGDTAVKLAANGKPAGVSLDQMLVAMLRANPQAFVNGNVNRLRAGVTLELPDEAAASAISSKEARSVLATQSRDFNEFRHRLAGMTTAAPATTTERQVSGKVKTEVKVKSPTQASPDKLTLSKPSVNKAKPTKEDEIAKARQTKETASREAELTKNIADLTKIATEAAVPKTPTAATPAPSPTTAPTTAPAVNNTTAPATTPTAAPAAPTATAPSSPAPAAPAATTAPPPVAAPATSSPATPPTPPAPPPAVADPAPATSPSAGAPPAPAGTPTTTDPNSPTAPASAPTTDPSSAPPTAPAVPNATGDTPPPPVVPTPVAAEPPKPVLPPVVPAPIPVEEPSFIDTLIDDPLVLPAGGVLLAVVLGAAAWRIRSRQKASGNVDSSFLESRLQPDSFFGASGGQNVDTAEAVPASASSMMYSPSQLDAGGDVDPVAEADVYLAYGRDLQAEEILKEALRTDPQRVAIHCKLLDIYAKRRDVKAFEVLGYEVYSLTQGFGPEWEGVCDLGRELAPDNPLYQPGGMPPAPQGGMATGASVSPGMLQTQPHMAAFNPQATERIEPTVSAADLDLDLDFFSLGDDDPTGDASAASPAHNDAENAEHGAFDPEMSFETTSAGTKIPALDFDDFAAPAPLPPVPPLAPGQKLTAHKVGQVAPFTPPAAAAPTATPDSFDFDLGGMEFSLDEPTAAPPPAPVASKTGKSAAAPVPTPADDLSMDMLEFDMGDMGGMGDLSHASAGGTPTGPSDLMQMERLSADMAASAAEEDPLETKLSLAAEFLAIGDNDAARSLAEEVVEQASGALKKRATKFLSDMA